MTVAVFSEATVSASLTLGMVPPARVGPSLTTHQDKLYVFGGRLIAPIKVTNELYSFDLNTNAWEQLYFEPSSPQPSPRYFHSATVYDDKFLIITGGQGEPNQDETPNVLNDICILNLGTKEWEIFELNTTSFPSRYAHLTSMMDQNLFIIGGQDADNQYLNDIYAFNLETKALERASSITSGVGSYRSTLTISPDEPDKLYVFSNTRFNNPIRELMSINKDLSLDQFQFPSTGQDLPPAFRFPEGYIIGRTMVISGTYISNNIQSYCIWSLDLNHNKWSRVDTGSCFARGSWNRGVLHPQKNSFIVFGHRDREIVSDYNHRRINFNHVSIVNLEAFDIYRQPSQCEDSQAIELGLLMMYEPRFSNFAFITKDGFRIHINSGFLGARWPNYDTFLSNSQDKDLAALFSGNTLTLQESYQVIQVFVRYLYTDSLDFEDSQATDLVLQGKLLIFARNYAVETLYDRVASHLHALLDISNAPEIFQIASNGKRDGLKLRSLAVMIKDRAKLADCKLFWTEYPEVLRQEILRYMPPNFKPPTSLGASETKSTSTAPPQVPPSRKYSTLPKSPRTSTSSMPASPTPSIMSSTELLNSNQNDDSSISSNSDQPTPLPSSGTIPKKKTSGSSFLKFGSRRPSLANLFSFSSAASPSIMPPSTSSSTHGSPVTPKPSSPRTDGKGLDPSDAKLVRSLYELGLS